MAGQQETDTFSNPQVAELDTWDTGTSLDMNSQGQGLDTFESGDVILPEDVKEGEDEVKGQSGEQQSSKTTEAKKETKAGKSPKEAKETDLLDDQESDSDGEGDSKEEAPEGESSEEESESDGEEAADQKPEGKTIRLKEGDKALDVSEEATVAVKVKGKKEFVSLSELKKNYSGQKAWDEEFGKIEEQKKTFEQERSSFDSSRKETRAHFEKIGEKLHRAFKDPEADPLEAMEYLLEMAGQDVVQYKKRVMDHYGTLAYEFGQLSEAERELYWTKMENEVIRNNQANLTKAQSDRTAQEQRNHKAVEARKQYGVSEQDYDGARQEIESLGADMSQVSEEQISKYAATKPLVVKAENVCDQFQEDLSTDEMNQLISVTADTMFKYNHLTEVEAVKIAAKTLGYEIEDIDEQIEKLNSKVPEVKRRLDNSADASKKVAKRSDEHLESFDDYENDFYNFG
jgi:hypothetical protein